MVFKLRPWSFYVANESITKYAYYDVDIVYCGDVLACTNLRFIVVIIIIIIKCVLCRCASLLYIVQYDMTDLCSQISYITHSKQC